MTARKTALKNHIKAKKLTKAYIKKQIKYFTMRHNKVKDLKSKLDYSNRIYFWETKLKGLK